MFSSDGVVVIGGTCTDDEQIPPLKEGDVATTTNINKLPTNPMTYETTENSFLLICT